MKVKYEITKSYEVTLDSDVELTPSQAEEVAINASFVAEGGDLYGSFGWGKNPYDEADSAPTWTYGKDVESWDGFGPIVGFTVTEPLVDGRKVGAKG